jgi:hypothetical protein
MHAEQLFTRLLSPVSGQPPPILHPASSTVKRPRSLPTFQPSSLPLFHSSESKSASKLSRGVNLENPWGLFPSLTNLQANLSELGLDDSGGKLV